MIRPYNTSDIEKITEVFQLNVPAYFAEQELNEFLDYLKKYADTYYIIEHNNQIIGGVGYEIRSSDKTGRINWIFIHPTFKGLGYGKKAAEFCLKFLKENNEIKKLVVRTSQHAHPFFENFGFKLISTKKNFWAKGLDLYLMEINLS